MLMILNFPVDRRLWQTVLAGFLFAGVLLGSCRTGTGVLIVPRAAAVAPDAPAAALPGPAAQAPYQATRQASQTVELKSVRVGRIDSVYVQYIAPHFFKTSSAPLAVVVQTQQPFDMEPRTSSPVIELNGEPIKNTRMVVETTNTLVGFLPDRERIKSRNAVTVVWIGAEEYTRTKNPLFFTPADIRE